MFNKTIESEKLKPISTMLTGSYDENFEEPSPNLNEATEIYGLIDDNPRPSIKSMVSSKS